MNTTPIDGERTSSIAAALRAAEAGRVPIDPPTTTHPALTLEDAYRIQSLNMRRRLGAGERRVGRKIGLTSLAMQRQLGVDQPDFGVITDTMVVADGGTLAAGELISPRIEAEFAFRIARNLAPAPAFEDLVAAVDGVAVALEIIDSRVADWNIGLVDTVADNASSARIVYGEFVPADPARLAALPSTTLTMTRDGVEVAAGPGSAVLGDPLVALHWLADAIGAYGDGFAAGEVVLAGAVAAAVPFAAGSVWSAVADGFQPVALTSV